MLHVSWETPKRYWKRSASDCFFVFAENLVKCDQCGEMFCSVINLSKHKRVLHVRCKNQGRKGKAITVCSPAILSSQSCQNAPIVVALCYIATLYCCNFVISSLPKCSTIATLLHCITAILSSQSRQNAPLVVALWLHCYCSIATLYHCHFVISFLPKCSTHNGTCAAFPLWPCFQMCLQVCVCVSCLNVFACVKYIFVHLSVLAWPATCFTAACYPKPYCLLHLWRLDSVHPNPFCLATRSMHLLDGDFHLT